MCYDLGDIPPILQGQQGISTEESGGFVATAPVPTQAAFPGWLLIAAIVGFLFVSKSRGGANWF